MLIKRDLFNSHNIKFPSCVYHEDIYTTYKLYYYAHNISICDEYLFYWLHRGSSILNSISIEIIVDYIRGWRERIDFLTKEGIKQKYMASMIYSFVGAISNLLNRISSSSNRIHKYEYYKVLYNAIQQYYEPIDLSNIKNINKKVHNFLELMGKYNFRKAIDIFDPISQNITLPPINTNAKVKLCTQKYNLEVLPVRKKVEINQPNQFSNRAKFLRTVSPFFSGGIRQNANQPLYSANILKNNMILIIGNGFSLRSFDNQYMQNFNSIGMNAACRHWRTTGIYPEYYICLDTVVIVSLKDEIYKLIHKRNENGIQLFLLRKKLLDFYPELKSIPEVIFFEDYFKSPYFEGLTSKITTGSFAALLGAMLGYKQIYLLGIDLDYVQQIPEAEKVEGHVLEITRTPTKNPNYFFDDYQRKGDRFHVPDAIPNLHYQSWVMVKERLERFGVHVLNCNPKSRLDIFDYADINDVLSR